MNLDTTRQERIAVLLMNLGTPEAPTPESVREYLGEFLGDPMIVEMPRILWHPILHGIILRRRPAVSAQRYRKVWLPGGSPLMVHTQDLARGLQVELESRGVPSSVRITMRYGFPRPRAVVESLAAEGFHKVVAIPTFPQWSQQTTATSVLALAEACRKVPGAPEPACVEQYWNHPSYIAALKESILEHWKEHGPVAEAGGKLLVSFHGTPVYCRDRGDPYYGQCMGTAALLQQALGIDDRHFAVCFQSRFGYHQWLSPYFSDTVRQLGQAHLPRVDVINPGFSTDCLETVEEIGIDGQDIFRRAGGGDFFRIACLNGRAAHARLYADLVCGVLSNWPESRI